MNLSFSVELLIGLLTGLITAMIVLIALQVRNSAAVNRLAAPVYDFVMHEAEEQAKAIVKEAKAEAKRTRAEAEQERDTLIKTYAKQVEELHQTFEEQLTKHTTTLEQTLDTTFQESVDAWRAVGSQMQERVSSAEKSVSDRFAALETSLREAQGAISGHAETAVTQFENKLDETVVALKEKLEAYDTTVTSKVDEHTSEALKAIDDALAAYRTARERIMDTHMTQIIEAVAADVLHKQLTLSEHADLAKQALIEAKQRHIL